ncbi:MAG: hypothetical protein ACI90G_002152, partial [Urechidicola sp.]
PFLGSVDNLAMDIAAFPSVAMNAWHALLCTIKPASISN